MALPASPPEPSVTGGDRLGALVGQGVSVGLAAPVRDSHVTGVTSNPTIFEQAIGNGRTYDGQIRDLAVRSVPVEEAARLRSVLAEGDIS
jgi:transaldolase